MTAVLIKFAAPLRARGLGAEAKHYALVSQNQSGSAHDQQTRRQACRCQVLLGRLHVRSSLNRPGCAADVASTASSRGSSLTRPPVLFSRDSSNLIAGFARVEAAFPAPLFAKSERVAGTEIRANKQ
jgi:hypothetical protein